MIANMVNEGGVPKLRLQFFVPGIPVAWTAATVTRHGAFSPKRFADYRDAVRAIAKIEMSKVQYQYKNVFPHLQDVDLSFQFKMPRPEFRKGRFPRPISKPDLTNCQKAIEDCLSRLFFKDDCQVCSIHSRKDWADSNDMIGVWVVIDLCRPRMVTNARRTPLGAVSG